MRQVLFCLYLGGIPKLTESMDILIASSVFNLLAFCIKSTDISDVKE